MKKYQLLLENTPDMIIEMAKDFTILYVNRVDYFKKEDVIGKNALDYLSEPEKKKVKATVKQLLETGKTPEIEIVWEHEGIKHTYISRHVLSGDSIQIIVTEVTERRRIEQRLLILEQGAEKSIFGIAIANMTGEITYMNPAALSLWGYDKEEIIGRSVVEFYKDPEEPLKVIESLISDGRFLGELTAKRKDGLLFKILLSAVLVEKVEQICLFGSLLDVTEYESIKEKLRDIETQSIMSKYQTLSQRERDIVDLLVSGMKEKRIRELLMIKSNNMSEYLHRIEQKFDVEKNRLLRFLKKHKDNFPL